MSGHERIPILFTENSKPKNAFLQIIEMGNNSKLLVYGVDISKRAKHEYSLNECCSEYYKPDQSKKTIVFTSPKHVVNFTFNTPAEAEQYLRFFNSKSEIYTDIKALKILNDKIQKIWPFPMSS